MAIIETHGLSKSYKEIAAVSDLDIGVEKEIFGLLGPNGSGKTTTVLMLTTLLKPTKGTATVCGCDILKQPARVRDHISYVPQEMALDLKSTGRENLVTYARLYGITNVKDKVDEVLAVMELTDRADEWVRGYSGGMRRKLELAQALVHDPEILFMDEPTIGLDIAAREMIWRYITMLRKKGTCIFVTTHYMDEADRYCERVAIIDRGNVVAIGTPESLKIKAGKVIITIRSAGDPVPRAFDGLTFIGEADGEYRFAADDYSDGLLPSIRESLKQQGVQVKSISAKKPSLDDAFLMNVSCREETSFDYNRFHMTMRNRT